MTAVRRPDGSGGPLSENERIDDMQFYVDPRAELLIDDMVLYDAAVPGEKRPFPKSIQFTGLFDTGKQGQGMAGRLRDRGQERLFLEGGEVGGERGDEDAVDSAAPARRAAARTRRRNCSSAIG